MRKSRFECGHLVRMWRILSEHPRRDQPSKQEEHAIAEIKRMAELEIAEGMLSALSLLLLVNHNEQLLQVQRSMPREGWQTPSRTRTQLGRARSRRQREHRTRTPPPMSDDLFEDEHLKALYAADQSQVDELRASAQIAAAQTFGPFNDAPDSPFYSAKDLSPTQTWKRIAERVGLATVVAVVHGLARRPITVDAIRCLHEIIFVTTFPEHAGRLRKRNEEGAYGIVLGTADEPIVKSERATAGARIVRRLEQICDECNDTVAEQEQRDAIVLGDPVFTAVRLYAKVLSAHPFLDGNGRTAFTLLQYALMRNGLACVALEDFGAHQRALGTALRSDGRQSYGPLQALIVDKLVGTPFPDDN